MHYLLNSKLPIHLPTYKLQQGVTISIQYWLNFMYLSVGKSVYNNGQYLVSKQGVTTLVTKCVNQSFKGQ